ncbi:phage major capsid protein, partial [Bacillus thuringiensis]|nr:phage major capsid protein [Bacillus thuringiensis]
MTQAITLPETIANLEQYVRTVNVSTTSGSYPILESTKAVMVSVLELVENPKLAEPTFKEVDWKVQTFRGYIPISNESLQDSDMDLAALVARHIMRIALN